MKYLSHIYTASMMVIFVFGCGMQENTYKGVGSHPSNQQNVNTHEVDESEIKDKEAEEEVFTMNMQIDFDEPIEILGLIHYHCKVMETDREIIREKDNALSCQTSLTKMNSTLGKVEKESAVFFKTGNYLIKNLHSKKENSFRVIKILDKSSDQAQFISDFKINAFKDSFYDHIYHFEILPFLSKAIQMKEEGWPSSVELRWKISGGRYYFLDDELPLFKKFRVFQKSILFLEKSHYAVTIEMSLNKKDVLKKEFSLNLEQSSDFQEPMKAQFEIDNFDFNVNEPFGLFRMVENNHHSYSFKWDVKKIEDFECSKTLMEIETNPLAKQICNYSYEKNLLLGDDYFLDHTNLQQASLVIKKSGRYVIDFQVWDHNDQMVARSRRNIELH